jgi:hypothetical protein
MKQSSKIQVGCRIKRFGDITYIVKGFRKDAFNRNIVIANRIFDGHDCELWIDEIVHARICSCRKAVR